jgi:hypothetical protein
VRVRLLQPLSPGQEVMITYIDPLQPVRARREALREGFAFQCLCQRCSEASTAAVQKSGAAERIDESQEDHTCAKSNDLFLDSCRTQVGNNELQQALVTAQDLFLSKVCAAAVQSTWYLLMLSIWQARFSVCTSCLCSAV